MAVTEQHVGAPATPDDERYGLTWPDLIPVWGPGKHGLSGRLAWALLFLILAWASLARIAFFHGWAGSDDIAYHLCATQMKAGLKYHDPAGPIVDNRAARVSFVAMTAVWISLFGESERALCSLDVAAGVMVVLALYWVAAIIVGRRIALWAALLYSVWPPALVYNGILFPDHFGLAWLLLAMGSYLKALTWRSRFRWGWITLGGVSLAIAVSAKETALVFGLLLPLLGLCRCRMRQFGIGLAIGLIGFVVFMGELPVHKATTGDWLYRLHAAEASFGPGGMSRQALGLSQLFFYPIALAVRQDVFGIFGWLLIAALAWTIAKWRCYSFVAAWTLAAWLFLEFAPSSLTGFQLLPRDIRFVGAVTILLFIPLAELAMILYRYAGRARWVVGAVLIGVLFNGVFTANQYAQPLYWAAHHRMFRTAIAMRERGECPALVLPDALSKTIYPTDQPAFADMNQVEMSAQTRGLPSAELILWPARGRSLVVPKDLFRLMRLLGWYKRVTPDQYEAFLDQNARRLPLYDQPPPLDRFLMRLRIERLSQKRILGYIYLLPE